jgi:outer membrane protein assembly factor BamB
VTIDLGDVSVAAPDGPRAAAIRRRPPALVAVLLLLLALGGSAVSAPQVETVLNTAELPGGFRLSRTALFTTGYVAARPQVRRYPLTGTSPAWTTGLRQPVGDIALVQAARVLVVTSPESLEVSVLDSETGAVLWRRSTGATLVRRTADDSALMTSPAGIGGEVVVERVGLRTGATVWSRKLTAVTFLHAGRSRSGGTSPIVAVDRRGRATVLNFADGRVLRTADLGAGSELARHGDRLYATRGRGGRGTLAAYRVSDLRRLWQTTTSSFGWASECGPYLCLSTATSMTVVDAATGAERWSTTQWREGSDSRALGIPGPFRLVVSDARHTFRRALLDPATGAVVTDLGDVILIGPAVLRVDKAQSGRVWIQRFGAHGDVRTVGSIEGESLDRCAAEGEHLACLTRRGRATVWQATPDQ